MRSDEVRHYPGLNDNDPELVTVLKKIRYDLTDLQVKVSEALRMAGTLEHPDTVKHICPHDDKLEFRSSTRLAEHVYHQHDGPLPKHYADAERLAAIAAGEKGSP